jgi:FeS assembly protein IscX
MARKLGWLDSEEIAVRLHELHPNVDPLTVRFTDLREWVCALEDFGDDPHQSNEAKLEAIQMAWQAEHEDAAGERGPS